MASALDEQACLLSKAEWKKQLLEHIAIAVQRGNADIMLRDAQRKRGRCEFRVIRGGKVPPHRLGAPLYSVSDVPWLRNGGNGGDSGGRRGTPPSIIPASLPPRILASLSPSSPGSVSQHSEGAPPSIVFDSCPSLSSASLSPSSLVASPSPDREGNDGDELMQVTDASGGAVALQRDDSGVSGSSVSSCTAAAVTTSIPAAGDGAGGGTGVVTAPTSGMEVEVMEWGSEEVKWRECGRDVV
jgi:hypothetical protein